MPPVGFAVIGSGTLATADHGNKRGPLQAAERRQDGVPQNVKVIPSF